MTEQVMIIMIIKNKIIVKPYILPFHAFINNIGVQGENRANVNAD